MTVVGVFEYPTFATSLYLELFNVYSIAHYGADRVLTASRPWRQKAGGIIVEDSGVFHFLIFLGGAGRCEGHLSIADYGAGRVFYV